MVQSDGDLEYDDVVKPRRWSKGRASCDSREPIKTVEIDTFQPYRSPKLHNPQSPSPCRTRPFQAQSASPRLHNRTAMPSYMAATASASARARTRSQSVPRSGRVMTPGREKTHSGSAKKRLSFPVPEPGLSDGEYNLTSPSYKSVVYYGRSNMSSCCNESIEDDETYPPPATNELKRWLR